MSIFSIRLHHREGLHTRQGTLSLLIFFSFFFYQQEVVARNEWKLSVSSSFGRSTASNGSEFSDLTFPLSLSRYFEKGNASLTIPILSSSGSTESQAISGLGDIRITGRYYLARPSIITGWGATLAASLKFPTANSEAGLGTGSLDERLGIELMKGLSEPLVLFSDLGYTFAGTSSTHNVINWWDGTVGLSYAFNDDWYGTLSTTHESPLVEGSSEYQVISTGLRYWFPNNSSIAAEVGLDLSGASSPLTLSVNYSTFW